FRAKLAGLRPPVSFQINFPTVVVAGGGAVKELGPQLVRLGARRVLLVTDAWMASSDVAGQIREQVTKSGMALAVFSDVKPDPTDASVLAGLRVYREQTCDTVVALGGGSPIDAAKAIAMLAANPEPLSQYQGYHRVGRAGAPLIAIPTTAGTGSEV